MSRLRQQIKLPTDLVNEIQKIKDKRHRSAWRQQFKNDYAVKEMYEENLKDAIKPMPENPSEFDRKWYASKRKLMPEWERKLKKIKERISKYQEGLEDFLKEGQNDIEKYVLIYLH